MIRNRRFLFPSLMAMLGIGVAVLVSRAAVAPSYAITATNVTMPASGLGSTAYTVTAVPMTGTLMVNCQYSGPKTTAKLPTCVYGPVEAPMQVTAGQMVTGRIYFYPYGSAIPAELQRTRKAPWSGLAMAGVLLLGVGLRRRARRWIALALVAGASLAGLASISACGGSTNGSTPGACPFTISAINDAALNPLGVQVTTTITVTVP